MTEVSVPDLGDFAEVPVIEIHVAAGDVVSAEDPLVTLESDKATMDIPSPAAGTVREVQVKVGDLVSRGSAILLLEGGGTDVEPPQATVPVPARGAPVTAVEAGPADGFEGAHAGPGVRRLARELDLDLSALAGTGPKGRITKEDVIAAVRGPADGGAGVAAVPAGGGIPAVPAQDFSKFGPVEVRPLT